MAESALKALRAINHAIALVIGMGLLACAGFVLCDIILRQFGASFGGTDEISGYVMAVVSAWGMSFTLLELGHVRIDLLRRRFATPLRVVMDLLSLLVLAVAVSLIALQCWPVLEKSLINQSRANTVLETPLWWVQLPWLAGWLWFALTAWLSLLAALVLVVQQRFIDVERAIGPSAVLENEQ
ncbi:MAG: TRAP transporter small permease [Granulosicoccus sp.]|nr:TRAP transporter small permease [Granulosicoccus sp.]